MSAYGWTLSEYRDGTAVEVLASGDAGELSRATTAVSRAMSVAADTRRTSLHDSFWHSPLVGQMDSAQGGHRVFPFRDGTSVLARIWRNDA